MIEGLVSGRIHGDVERRVDKVGNTFTVAKLRAVSADGDTLFVNVIVFDPSVAKTLADLLEGDAVSVSGSLNPKVWVDKQGNHRPALDMVARRVLCIRDDCTGAPGVSRPGR